MEIKYGFFFIISINILYAFISITLNILFICLKTLWIWIASVCYAAYHGNVSKIIHPFSIFKQELSILLENDIGTDIVWCPWYLDVFFALGVDPNHIDKDHKTLLMRLSRYIVGRSYEDEINYIYILHLIEKLMSYASVNLTNSEGDTLLLTIMPDFAMMGYEDKNKIQWHYTIALFDKILQIGADVNQKNREGNTPWQEFIIYSGLLDFSGSFLGFRMLPNAVIERFNMVTEQLQKHGATVNADSIKLVMTSLIHRRALRGNRLVNSVLGNISVTASEVIAYCAEYSGFCPETIHDTTLKIDISNCARFGLHPKHLDTVYIASLISVLEVPLPPNPTVHCYNKYIFTQLLKVSLYTDNAQSDHGLLEKAVDALLLLDIPEILEVIKRDPEIFSLRMHLMQDIIGLQKYLQKKEHDALAKTMARDDIHAWQEKIPVLDIRYSTYGGSYI